MDNFNRIGSFCGKRRQPFDDGMDGEVMHANDETVFTQTPTSFLRPSGDNSFNQASTHAPKRICNGVSSVHNQPLTANHNLPTNQTMQSYQEVPTMGGDSRLFLDSPPHDGGDHHRTMDTVTMETAESMDMSCDPIMRQGGYHNGALYNMREMGQQLRGVTTGDIGFKASSQQRVCLRCLAGEAGHITHILGCVG